MKRTVMLALAALLGSACSVINHISIGPEDGGSDAGQTVDAAFDAGTDGGPDAGPCPPCSGDTPLCDPAMGRCVECLDNTQCADGDPCTADRCSLGTCSSTPDPSCIADVECGNTHTCVRRGSGDVLCWGTNNTGQLGDGTMMQRASPVRVAVVMDTEELAAGTGHSCAATAGMLRCWGANTAGQLGTGSTSAPALTPVSVPGLAMVAAVGAGASNTCALRMDGTVACWGEGVATPTNVTAVTGADEIAVGAQHVCARMGGNVICWGNNSQGQLGDGSTTASPTPVTVSGLADATAITAGTLHTCALRASRAVVCWGFNFNGQLGNDSTSRSPTPVPVSGLIDAVEVSAGGAHTCARRSGGEVVCWGKNQRGQLGDGSMLESHVPLAVDGLSDAVQISAGADHSCARRTTGEVVCWGENTYGQIGDGTMTDASTPTSVTGL